MTPGRRATESLSAIADFSRGAGVTDTRQGSTLDHPRVPHFNLKHSLEPFTFDDAGRKDARPQDAFGLNALADLVLASINTWVEANRSRGAGHALRVVQRLGVKVLGQAIHDEGDADGLAAQRLCLVPGEAGQVLSLDGLAGDWRRAVEKEQGK
jgi:hypothetical protein